jgi:oligopeptide transport system permease protein
MTAYIIRRVFWLVPVLFTVSVITFGLMHSTPGGPFDRDSEQKQINPILYERLVQAYGLDKPIWQQYLIWAGNAIRLDLGPSYQYKDRNVTDLLRDQFPFSARLGLQAVLFAMIVGIPLGVIAALRQNSWIDYLALFIATIGIAVPSFVLALYLILLFSVTLGWAPVAPTAEQFNTQLTAWVLPTIALGIGAAAFLARMTRTSMLDAIRQDYVRTARAKGLASRVVVSRHVIKNAMIPVWTVIGPITAALITGSFIIERIFGVPGIGRFFVDSIGSRDYSMIMGTTLFYAFMIALFNLLVDIGYGLFDPRVKVSK